MSVEVSGKNVELTQGLVDIAERKVSRLGRYMGGLARAEVRFSEERNPRIADKDVCDLLIVGARRSVIRAHASADNPTVALDKVVDKALHRAEKLKVH